MAQTLPHLASSRRRSGSGGVMRVICAWCLREGAQGLVEERAPLGDERETYGICPSHRLELLIGRYLRALAFGSGPR